MAQFGGQSYLSYAAAPASASAGDDDQLEVRVQFSTRAAAGLVAYAHNADASVYAAVYVESGALKLRLSCGRHQMTLVETKRNVSDGAVHSARLRLVRVQARADANATYCMGSVKLNQSYSMHGEQRLATPRLAWPGRLHVGGQPSAISSPPEILFLPGLVGCLYSVEVASIFYRFSSETLYRQ